MAYIEVKNVEKSFGKQQVLHGINFEIKKGERFGLIGPNGAGKSTLIDVMTGLTRADSGGVIVDGKSIKTDAIAIRKEIGVVPQDLALIETLNAYDNLEYFGGMYGISFGELKTRIAETLEAVGLVDSAKKKVKTYSGGMKRRLNLAVAILHRPKFLILDEPTVGIDPQSRQHIFDFLNRMNQEGTTILYTSHYMEEIEAFCDRLFIVDLGREVAYGTKDQVKALVGTSGKVQLILDRYSEGLSEALLSSNNGIKTAEGKLNTIELVIDTNEFSMMKLISLLEERQIVIKSISVENVSLEEAFLQLTGKKLRD
ncbi:ABC transporter ATP-binding protein [Bavariicoccus seileri]|uniref:ABC transporter ATP-binding protein n=1 Tax=Bavariicoccus seileri TaxID=549685 RepID=UPI0003B34129|nr:ABC transporter ATP-binding protein [Bavariicoccus seileri]